MNDLLILNECLSENDIELTDAEKQKILNFLNDISYVLHESVLRSIILSAIDNLID